MLSFQGYLEGSLLAIRPLLVLRLAPVLQQAAVKLSQSVLTLHERQMHRVVVVHERGEGGVQGEAAARRGQQRQHPARAGQARRWARARVAGHASHRRRAKLKEPTHF